MLVQEEVMIKFKGKRSKRPRPASPLALTMATSSSTTAEISDGVGFGGDGGVMSDVTGSFDIRVTTSVSDSGGFTQSTDEDEEDMANCLILLANGQSHKSSQPPATAAASNAAAGTVVELYQCKTCNKSFSSFQALGGHRASHKKPNKPITPEERKASIRDHIHKPDNILSNHTILSLQLSNRVLDSYTHPQNKSRVHECSMCGAEFASGQALGGHMRRHRPIPTASANNHGAESQEAAKKRKNLLSLDLNLPAPEDDHHRESKFPFTPKEQVIVFSTSPLIDCQY